MICSNQQQLNHLSFLIINFINKQTQLQWVHLQVRHWLMPFFVIMKKFGFNECLFQFKPAVYRHYVDDIFVLFKSKEHLKISVNYMNPKHKNIKFTFETEDCNSFSFLDVKIIRKNKRFVTSIFRKATFSAVFTNYDNFIFDA